MRQERVEQLLKQLEKRLEQLKELEKMTLEEMWEQLGFTDHANLRVPPMPPSPKKSRNEALIRPS